MTKKDWDDILLRLTLMDETVQRLPKFSQTRLTIQHEIWKMKELIEKEIGLMK